MADETVVLQLDIGGDSDDAQAAVRAAADVLDDYKDTLAELANVADDSSARMGEGMMDLARDSDEAAVAAQGVADSAGEATGSMSTFAGAADEADSALQAIGGSGDEAAGGLGNAAGAADSAAGSFSEVTGTIDGLVGSLGEAGDEIDVFTGGATEAAGGVGELFTAIQTGSGGALAAVGTIGIAGLATFTALGTGAAEYYGELVKLQALFGSTVLEAEAWNIVAQLNDISVNTLAKSATRLGNEVATAREEIALGGEQSATTTILVDQLGVAFTDQTGKVRSNSEILSEVLFKLSQMDDISLRNATSSELFGSRMNTTLIPVLNRYNETVPTALQLTEEFGGKTGDAAEQNAKYNEQMTRLHLQIQELELKVGPPFIKFLTAVVTATNAVSTATGNAVEWVRKHKDEVLLLSAVLTAPFSLAIAGTILAVGFLSSQFQTAAAAAETLIGVLGRVKDAADKVADIGGGIVGKVGGVVSAGAGILGFDGGGIVPGPRGAPMLAVVHGEEEIRTPEQQRQGARSAPQITVTNHIYGVQNAEDLARETERSVSRALFRMGFA